jgi:adenosylcobyric acid synthase
MRVAELADAPVLLVGDIDRGGVFASLVGTLALLQERERERVKGFVINKFRGQRALLEPGLDWLEKQTGVPVLGVIPYMEPRIEAEDSLSLASLRLKKGDEAGEALNIHVIALPRISNFTDLDPLYDEPGVHVRLISKAADWGHPDVIVIPGTKNTTEDLVWLRESGLAARIVSAVAAGAHIAGICGGYQMLGEKLWDPDGVESVHRELDGLGLLPVTTRFVADKKTVRAEGRVVDASFAANQTVTGYEIHLGRTERTGGRPFIRLADGRLDGVVALDGRAWGTYLHGIFHNRAFTRAWLNRIRREKGMAPVNGPIVSEAARREASYRALANFVRSHLDMEKLYQVMGLG